MSPRCRARRGARGPARRAAHRPRPGCSLAQSRDALAPALVLVPEPTSARTMGDKYRRTASSRSTASRARAAGSRRRARRRALPAAREGARGLRLAAHLPRARPDELAFFLGYTTVDSFVQELCLGEEFSIDVFCDLERRCLNAIPRTMIQSKGGESIKGDVDQGPGADRARAHVAETRRHRRARERPVLPRAGRLPAHHRRQPALRRRVSAAARRRQPLPGARARARARRASGAALGEFRAGVVMTRFFSDLCLTPGRREPRAVRGGAARAARRRARRGVIRLLAATGRPGPGGGVRAAPSEEPRRRRGLLQAAATPSLAAAPAAEGRGSRVVVTVVDGDTHRRVRGARVVIGRAPTTRTSEVAYAADQAPHGASGPVSKPGYAPRTCGCPSSNGGG